MTDDSLLDNSDLPLVLIGGTLCNARLWQPVIERLNVAAAMSVTLTGTDSAAGAARRLLQNLPPRFLLAGFSLGAIVALQIAADAPQRLGGLALMSVNPLADRPENAAARREAVLAASREGLRRWLLAALWPNYVAPQRQEDAALRDLIGLMAEECGLATFAGQTEIAIGRQDHREALAALTCPMLIINGAQDVICTPHHHQLLAQSAPGARRFTVAASGHFIPLEAPDRVAQALRQWLTESLDATK